MPKSPTPTNIRVEVGSGVETASALEKTRVVSFTSTTPLLPSVRATPFTPRRLPKPGKLNENTESLGVPTLNDTAS